MHVYVRALPEIPSQDADDVFNSQNHLIHFTLNLHSKNTLGCVVKYYLRFAKDKREYPIAPRAVRSRAEVRRIGVILSHRLRNTLHLYINYGVFVCTSRV